MSANMFNRLSTGQDFLQNAYSQENLEKQAKKLASQQVKAVQGVAHQAIQSAIGESGVEAAVGAAGIAYPFVKKYAPELTDKLPDLSRGFSGVADSAASHFTKTFQDVRQAAAATGDSRPRVPDLDLPKLPTLEDIRGRIEPPSVRASPISRQVESENPIGGLFDRAKAAYSSVRQRLTQDPRYRPDMPRPDIKVPTPEDVPFPTASKISNIPTPPADVPQVSAPQSERLARQAARRAERLKAQQEFGGGDEEYDAVLKGKGFKQAFKGPQVEKATELDPATFTPTAPSSAKGFAQRAVERPVETMRDRDPYQDAWDKREFDEQRLAMSQDREAAGRSVEQATDYQPESISKTEHLARIRPKLEEVKPVEAGGARPAAAVSAEKVFGKAPLKARINPADQTGGISPADLPEGAGFQRGAVRIGAKKDVDPSVPSGTAKPAFGERDIPELKSTSLQNRMLGEDIKEPQSGFEDYNQMFKPLEFDLPTVPTGTAQEKAPAISESQPVEPLTTKEPLPEPEVKPPSIATDIEKSITKAAPEEEAAADLPAIGEVALAAVGVGQLVASLVERHKQNKEEQSEAAQSQNQPAPHVALDPSVSFDSTFR